MKTNRIKRVLSFLLAGAMVISLSSAAGVPVKVYAEETKGTGKYVGDVYIAYGKSEEKAAKWLTDHGWEPVKGDFNAGKASFYDNNKIQDQNVAAVMGIKRTGDKNNAVTDMAVMNMTGGYNIPDYEKLLEEKKSQITEMVNGFKPVLNEYRANLDNKGSDYGKKRADLAYDLLNKFHEGNPKGEYAVNDTGWKLGDFFKTPTRQEGNKDGGDLEQMILESSGPAILAVESLLVLAADTDEQTWVERASGLTGDDLAENLVKYAPQAAGRDIAPSEVPMYLNERYGDTATTLADQWSTINEDMLWFESYNEENSLWPNDDESNEDYAARVAAYFEDLEKTDKDRYDEEEPRYSTMSYLYFSLYEVPYSGDWGESMGDFFNPAGGESYQGDRNAFLPMAAVLSEGQRVGLNYLSLQTLLLIGLGTEKGLDLAKPDLEELFGDQEELDIYTGVNREAFRTGVALTNQALMEQNMGKGQAFDKIWDNTGIVAITSYAAAIIGAVSLVSGFYMVRNGYEMVGAMHPADIEAMEDMLVIVNEARDANLNAYWAGQEAFNETFTDASRRLDQMIEQARGTEQVSRMGIAGRWMMGIGGALLIGAAIVSGIRLWKYYDRDMKPIPRMIVDESDIVTYLKDENGQPLLDEKGNQKKNIDFNTYEFYEAVKCNRPDVGEIGDWNDGVSDYKNKDHYCYDIADLNADMGQEWVALYTVKSRNKGNPVLADSLTLQYGKKDKPEGCTQALHLFTFTNAVDLGDTAWAYNNDKKGVYFFWDADENAFAEETASTFGTGQMAMAGIGGLLLGIAGAAFVFNRKRREENSEAA